ncbi:hypothetical protein QTG56_00150 [Rossellomorea sp. AcN35-11]|nr:hypothetical protein [Rossellomorea aquimaris]WJV29630.1 hypothetical protein QTG56_00150 [Rossellomorea sp. AcN35-11]
MDRRRVKGLSEVQVRMNFWTWVAMSVALVGGIAAANSSKKKAEKKHLVALGLVYSCRDVIFCLVVWTPQYKSIK